MSKHIVHDEFYEHFNYSGNEVPGFTINENWTDLLFRDDTDKPCVEFRATANGPTIHTGYYVGTDWLEKGKEAIYIAPKLDKENDPTDYLEMLFKASSNPEFQTHLNDLFEIKLNEPFISIPQKLDILTPLLVVHYLNLLNGIVRKGLKKGYYRVEKNLHAKVKGKVIIGTNIKQNLVKGQFLKTVCQYDEFGVNCPENRILKNALNFSSRYLASVNGAFCRKELAKSLAFISPAFEEVSADADVLTIRTFTLNSFFRDYNAALKIAKLIIQRYGFNIQAVDNSERVSVPPFWINMTKLFELFVLEQLRRKYGHSIYYQLGTRKDRPDYLLNTNLQKIIIDAKYKPSYKQVDKSEDIRQLSGYARSKGILERLGFDEGGMQGPPTHCLIIYPDQTDGLDDLNQKSDILSETELPDYINFHKIAVKLPTQ